jgi:hypothetical protein
MLALSAAGNFEFGWQSCQRELLQLADFTQMHGRGPDGWGRRALATPAAAAGESTAAVGSGIEHQSAMSLRAEVCLRWEYSTSFELDIVLCSLCVLSTVTLPLVPVFTTLSHVALFSLNR